MKFKFIKQCAGLVPSYGGNAVNTGDIIELEGHLARKAMANHDYVIANDDPPDPPQKVIADDANREIETPRRGRPPKVKYGNEG